MRDETRRDVVTGEGNDGAETDSAIGVINLEAAERQFPVNSRDGFRSGGFRPVIPRACFQS